MVSIQKVKSGNAQMLSNAYFAGQGDPVHTATEHGYSIRDVAYDGIAYADLTLGSGAYLEVVVQANTTQELPSDAAASAAAFDVTAVGLLTGGTASPATSASSPAAVQTTAYQPDPGETGTACELLPSAAVNALFGPLQPFYAGNVNNVSLTNGLDTNGNPYCVVEWYTGTGASDAWQVTVGAVQPTTDAEDSLTQFLSNYQTSTVPGGVTGEVYGQGQPGTSVAGQRVATVPMSGCSYLYVSGTIGSTPLSAPIMTEMLRVMVAMALKYPVSGLEGISSLP